GQDGMTKENVLIVAVKKNNQLEHHFEASVTELESLSQTAGGTVVSTIRQNRMKIHPVTYVGEGKVEEIKQLVIAHEIDLVIANDELSPGQLRNLNDHFGVRVIDRSQLILDILDRKSTRLNSSHVSISYAVFCLKK